MPEKNQSFAVSLFTIFLTHGIITSDVGKLTKKPIINARIHFSTKLGPKPKFIQVRIKDIENDMPNDINAPNNIGEYFFFNFMIVIEARQVIKM